MIKQPVHTGSRVTAVASVSWGRPGWAGTAEAARRVSLLRRSDRSRGSKPRPRRRGFAGHGVVAMASLGADRWWRRTASNRHAQRRTGADHEARIGRGRNESGRRSSLRTHRCRVGGRQGCCLGARNLPPTATSSPAPRPGNRDNVGITALAWTPDGGLITADRKGGLQSLQPRRASTASVDMIGPGGWISAVAVLGDDTLVTGGTDGVVGFRSAATGCRRRPYRKSAHRRNPRSGADRRYTRKRSVASVAGDGYLVFWNQLTGEPALAPIQLADITTSVAWDSGNPLHGVTGGQTGATLLDYGAGRLPPVAHEVPGWSNVAAVATSLPVSDWRRSAPRELPQNPVTRLTRSDTALTRMPGRSPSTASWNRCMFTPDGGRVLASTRCPAP